MTAADPPLTQSPSPRPPLPPVFSVSALLPTLPTLKAALVCTSITAFTGTFVAPPGGVADVTVAVPASAWVSAAVKYDIQFARSAPDPGPADP